MATIKKKEPILNIELPDPNATIGMDKNVNLNIFNKYLAKNFSKVGDILMKQKAKIDKLEERIRELEE